MAFSRSCGILLHPSSLPGGHGIGDFGPAAYEFLDYLEKARQGLWQILPLGPVNDSGSPYQTLSSFAGNTLLISLEKLVTPGLLSGNDLNGFCIEKEDKVDFSKVIDFKVSALKKAYHNFRNGKSGNTCKKSFNRFQEDQAEWLDDYALFAALKTHFSNKAWWQWDDKGIVSRKTEALEKWSKELKDEIDFNRFCQFVFYSQWGELKADANRRGIKIVGDIPIYTAHDSADVWAEPELFEIDPETGEALLMAGAPPDYFCEDGQLWGNPIYKWDKHEQDGYKWWLRRMKASLLMADILRVDHFRGFEAYWEVKSGEKTARNGKWVKGPGQKFFQTLKEKLGDNLPLIAEDLGVITPEVEKLRDDNDLPGMKILQFAFCDGANFYRPHTYDKNCVVYTGTHDNDTTIGWYNAEGDDYSHMGRDIIDQERDLCRRYLARDGSAINWDLIRLALSSSADTAVYPMQDILGLDNANRMNRPGTAEGNWSWRMTIDQLNGANHEYLAELSTIYDRFEPTEA